MANPLNTNPCCNVWANHTFQVVVRTWEESSSNLIPNHFSKEIMVCVRCGKVIDPWEKQ